MAMFSFQLLCSLAGLAVVAGSSWTQLTKPSGVVRSYGSTLVWDTVGQGLLLFGGRNDDIYTNDLFF